MTTHCSKGSHLIFGKVVAGQPQNGLSPSATSPHQRGTRWHTDKSAQRDMTPFFVSAAPRSSDPRFRPSGVCAQEEILLPWALVKATRRSRVGGRQHHPRHAEATRGRPGAWTRPVARMPSSDVRAVHPCLCSACCSVGISQACSLEVAELERHAQQSAHPHLGSTLHASHARAVSAWS